MKVTLAIPCLNEEAVLEHTIEQTVDFAKRQLADYQLHIVIVDNGSNDGTEKIGRSLGERFPKTVTYRRLGQRGKGLAVRTAWAENPADIYAFMDADLATDLSAMPSLLASCAANDGLAIGSRYLPQSEVERSGLRHLLSLGYRMLLRCVLGTKINDLPCGFKAASSKVAERILPQVEDSAWFFDTELVIRTEKAGLPVTEIPVIWHEPQMEGRRSKVPLFKVAANYLKLSWRLRQQLKRQKQ